MSTANMSGYSAKNPGALMLMWSLQNISIWFPMSSSNVALHARATLDVPKERFQDQTVMLTSRKSQEQNMTDFTVTV